MNIAGQKGEEPFCKRWTLPTPHKSVPALEMANLTNIQTHRQRSDLVKLLKQNEHLILFKHCFN